MMLSSEDSAHVYDKIRSLDLHFEWSCYFHCSDSVLLPIFSGLASGGWCATLVARGRVLVKVFVLWPALIFGYHGYHGQSLVGLTASRMNLELLLVARKYRSCLPCTKKDTLTSRSLVLDQQGGL
eukprot:6468760-Amphidinium_carterae.1